MAARISSSTKRSLSRSPARRRTRSIISGASCRRAAKKAVAAGSSRIEPRALKDVDDWLVHYRRFYDESFDRLDSYLKTLQGKEPGKPTRIKGSKKESRH